MLSGAFNKALRDVTKRRSRSFLTVAGITIGVAGILAIMTTTQDMTAAQNRSFNNSSQADAVIGTTDAPDGLRNSLLSLPNVSMVQMRANYTTKWRVGDNWREILFIGYPDYGNILLNKIELQRGSLPSAKNVTIENSVLDTAKIEIGDDLAYRSITGEPDRDKYLKVVGFAKSPSYPSAAVTGTAIGYATIQTVRDMQGIEGSNEILVKLNRFRDREETFDSIRRLMARRNLPVNFIRTRDPDNFPGKRELNTLLTIMFMFSALGLLVSGFIVANTLSAIVGEQVGEIGAMKALGATRAQVLQIYALVCLAYGLLGTATGFTVGILGCWALENYLAKLMNIDVSLNASPSALAAGAFVGVGISLLGGLWPAWSGTSIKIKDALDTYGLSSTYGKGLVDRFLARVRIPPPLALSLRNLSRRKTRTSITVMVVAVSCAAFLAAWSTDESVRHSVDALYGVYGANGIAWFERPVGNNFQAAIKTIEGVDVVEPWAFGSATVKRTGVRLRGIPAQTTLYQKRVANGRWYQPEEKDAAVVSVDLARMLDIRVEDMIEIETVNLHRKVRVVGLVIDSATSVGSTSVGNILMPTDVVANLMGLQGNAAFFAISVHDPTEQHIQTVLNNLEKKYRSLSPGTYSMEQDKKSSRSLTLILTAMLYGMVLIVAAVGGIGVLNTLSLNVLERRREIGVMRSLGASDGNLLQVFLGEGLIMGATGSILGLAVGYPLSRYFVSTISGILFELEFWFTPMEAFGAVVFAVILAGLASVLPALGAARLPTSRALRYE